MIKGMQLPEGKTCKDCAHFERCKGLFMCKPENTECDWSPNRFHDAEQLNDPAKALGINS